MKILSFAVGFLLLASPWAESIAIGDKSPSFYKDDRSIVTSPILIAASDSKKGHKEEYKHPDQKNCENQKSQKHQKYYKYCKHCKINNCQAFQKLEVRSLRELAFGDVIAAPETNSTVIINPSNGSKIVIGAFDGGGRHHPAEFEILGEPDKGFVVILPASLTLKGAAGSEAQVSKFTGSFSNIGNNSVKNRVTGRFGRDGRALLLVGGSAKVSPFIENGVFFGSEDVIVQYLSN